ncbi:pentapeptide repeat-containing protein [Mastigocoleus testarum]|uniref:Effector-associated domain-containing protein n=1 Tax=Mastigocoleus testarum BC008 TaxID=371196 RepID=A0A0V7ZVA8_9CYAN|nr:pentapeptide repeat-containing protein [Mastigocoleus testarum]KST68306.1 hypothetical protein BC008_00685 [Mastigocoleus testarum BC008]KST68318.1 hypothetical protein BC008_00750 [Mastigocoleus testarum BC008]
MNLGLSDQKYKELQHALINAFPGKASLEQMLHFELDKNLYEIQKETNIQDIVLHLIKTAYKENWIEDLIDAARNRNPENPNLKATFIQTSNQENTEDDDKSVLVKKILKNRVHGQDFSGAYLYGATLSGANLSGANLSGAYLSGTNLSGANLSGAYLINAYLYDTYLYGVNLSTANLTNAYLYGANLSGAYLSSTDLSGADLITSKVENARFANNPGISEELKLYLIQSGAIFEDSPADHDRVLVPL